MRNTTVLTRLVTFRTELATLWRAFRAAETPLHLKLLMLFVPLYLVSPLDLLPDAILLLGWVDDLIVVPLLVNWIVKMLPQRVPVYARAPDGGKMIDGTYRQR